MKKFTGQILTILLLLPIFSCAMDEGGETEYVKPAPRSVTLTWEDSGLDAFLDTQNKTLKEVLCLAVSGKQELLVSGLWRDNGNTRDYYFVAWKNLKTGVWQIDTNNFYEPSSTSKSVLWMKTAPNGSIYYGRITASGYTIRQWRANGGGPSFNGFAPSGYSYLYYSYRFDFDAAGNIILPYTSSSGSSRNLRLIRINPDTGAKTILYEETITGSYDMTGCAVSRSTGQIHISGALTEIPAGGGFYPAWAVRGNGSTWQAVKPESGNFYTGTILEAGPMTGELFSASSPSSDYTTFYRFSGGELTPLGSFTRNGTTNRINALVLDPKYYILYAGGTFTHLLAGGTTLTVSHLAAWNGEQWFTTGTGTNGAVKGLAVDATGRVYAGGSFTAMNGQAINGLAVGTLSP